MTPSNLVYHSARALLPKGLRTAIRDALPQDLYLKVCVAPSTAGADAGPPPVPVRIAFISGMVPPDGMGAEIYAGALAGELAREHDVLVLSGSGSCEIEGVSFASLPHLPRLHPDDSHLRKAVWHLRDQWLPRVHYALASRLRTFRPDVVHTHEPMGLSAAVFTAAGRAQVPQVHTTHDLNLLCARVTMTRAGTSCGGRCASCALQRRVRSTLVRRHVHTLVTPSEYYRRLHIRAGLVSEANTVAIPQGAEGSGRMRAPDGERLRLGFIGQLTVEKGVRTLLAAFRNAPAGWRLFIAGDGPLEAEVKSAAARDARISALGWIDDAKKDEFYGRLDLLVIPSEWQETAPLVAAEAAVRGLPALVSDRGGLPETPEARVFHAGDPAELLNGALWLARPPERIVEASRRLLAQRERFLWSTHVERVERVLATAARGEATLPNRGKG